MQATPLHVLKRPRFGWLPEIRNVQVMTHSRCNANCRAPLSGDTLVVTRNGNRPIRDLVGELELLALSFWMVSPGIWIKSSIQSYGIQPLRSVVLKRGHEVKIVRTSPEHQWVTDSGFVETRHLSRHDLIYSCSPIADGRGTFWVIQDVIDLGQEEEVFCATVPGAECFTLADNLLTGNCPYIESEHAANPGKMTDETWRLILDNLAPFSEGLSYGKFCPYLMNEPLIDVSIFRKIADIYSRFPRTLIEVSTNGIPLTEKTVDKLFGLMAGRRHEIWVSHHGIDAATMQHIMQIDYEKATAHLIAMLKKSDGRFNIKIRGAGESRGVDYKPDFTGDQYRAYWDKMFVDHGINRANISVDAFSFHDRAGTLHREERGANKLNVGIVRKIDPSHPFACPRVDQWLHFDYRGGIRLCCMDYGHEVKLPNIHDMSLLEYFHSGAYMDLTEKISGRVGAEPGFICTRCQSPGG